MPFDPSNNRTALISTLVAIGVGAAAVPARTNAPPRRPNILWIVSEDSSPSLGCYGDPDAITPNLDRLAGEGIRFDQAFSNAPVCAPARATLITGMYACAIGSEPMRSLGLLPESMKFFTEYLRDAGYYCTNRSKEDYNLKKPAGAWDRSGNKATYRDRAKGQPFFSVINLGVSHEGQIRRDLKAKLLHDPAKVTLPPYHPDTPEVRRDWANYHTNVTRMDTRVGEILAESEADGLAEDTIVFYYGDHGSGMPRGKRWLYDSGLHVPLIVRVPEKLRAGVAEDWPEPGAGTDRLVSFVDFGPTVLSLASVPVPEHMHGKPFMGSQDSGARDFVYGYRARMDERFDLSRAVRDQRFLYIRNFMPHKAQGAYLEYMFQTPTTRVWFERFQAGTLTAAQHAFFATKPREELYDCVLDPHQVNNLARDPAHQGRLLELREELDRWMLSIRDLGLLPEGDLWRRAAGRPPLEMARSDEEYPLERILQAAKAPLASDPTSVEALAERFESDDPAVRFWAVTGCAALGEQAGPLQSRLRMMLADPSPDVRVVAAEALARCGSIEDSLPALEELLDHEDIWVRLRALVAIDDLDEVAAPLKPRLGAMRELKKEKGFERYLGRVAIKAFADLDGHQPR